MSTIHPGNDRVLLHNEASGNIGETSPYHLLNAAIGFGAAVKVARDAGAGVVTISVDESRFLSSGARVNAGVGLSGGGEVKDSPTIQLDLDSVPLGSGLSEGSTALFLDAGSGETKRASISTALATIPVATGYTLGSDRLLAFDGGTGLHKQIGVNTIFAALTPIANVDPGADAIPVLDVSSGQMGSITINTLFERLIASTSFDSASDSLLVRDESVGEVRKVKIEDVLRSISVAAEFDARNDDILFHDASAGGYRRASLELAIAGVPQKSTITPIADSLIVSSAAGEMGRVTLHDLLASIPMGTYEAGSDGGVLYVNQSTGETTALAVSEVLELDVALASTLEVSYLNPTEDTLSGVTASGEAIRVSLRDALASVEFAELSSGSVDLIHIDKATGAIRRGTHSLPGEATASDSGLMSASDKAKLDTLGSAGTGSKTISTDEPSGGADGDIWYQVQA